MAVPIVEDHTEANSTGASTDLVLDKPTSPVNGELLQLIVMDDPSNPGPSTDWLSVTGWTLEFQEGTNTSDSSMAVYWREADGTEPSTVTATTTGSRRKIGWYLRISGVDTSDPFDIIGTFQAVQAAQLVINGITTTVDDCLAFVLSCFDGGDGDPFTITGTGWSKNDDHGEGGGTGISGTWGTKSQATAGGTGNATVDASVTDGMGGIQFALAPTAGAGIAVPIAAYHHFHHNLDIG